MIKIVNDLNSPLQWFRIHPCKKFVSPRNISRFSNRNHQRKSFRTLCVCLSRVNRKIYNFSKWYFKRLTSLEINGEKTWENWENKISLNETFAKNNHRGNRGYQEKTSIQKNYHPILLWTIIIVIWLKVQNLNNLSYVKEMIFLLLLFYLKFLDV